MKDLGWAVEQLGNGLKIRSCTWNGYTGYIFLDTKREVRTSNGTLIYESLNKMLKCNKIAAIDDTWEIVE